MKRVECLKYSLLLVHYQLIDLNEEACDNPEPVSQKKSKIGMYNSEFDHMNITYSNGYIKMLMFSVTPTKLIKIFCKALSCKAYLKWFIVV